MKINHLHNKAQQMDEQINQNVVSQGMALASFMLSLSVISSMSKRGQIDHKEASEIFGRASDLLKRHQNFPGEADAMHFAQASLKMAEQMILASAVEKPQQGSN